METNLRVLINIKVEHDGKMPHTAIERIAKQTIERKTISGTEYGGYRAEPVGEQIFFNWEKIDE
jgi:predicted TIM-barrel enzyme